jgi:predicted CxxxxCH...CXXCH cytochrome family protein
MHRRSLVAVTLSVAAAATGCAVPRTESTASAGQCSGCHGGADNAAPPTSLSGATATSDLGVGAHQRHLRGGAVSAGVACQECHVVPSHVEDPGHMQGDHATVTFGAVATSGGAAPAWDRNAATCSGVYCHGATVSGGSNKAPTWTKVDGTQAACGTCHGIPPPAPHPQVGSATTACAGCHPGTVTPDGKIDLAGGLHIDGKVDVSGLACTSCHGDATRAATIAPAPPRDTHGNTSTTSPGVGAHQAHLVAGPLRGPVACSDCHTVPSSTSHSNGVVEITFSPFAGGAGAKFDPATASCSSVYCHGATLAGGTNKTPTWTQVDGTQAACGTCHGVPPSSGRHGDHSGRACSDCHGGSYSRTSADPSLHVNGTIDVGNHVTSWNAATGACVGCHGSASWY